MQDLIDNARERLLELLPALVRRYPFKPYRNYRIAPASMQDEALIGEASGLIDAPDGTVHIRGETGCEAVAIAHRLGWESTFFGLQMARLDYLFGDDTAARRDAVKACLDALHKSGVRHVSARLDAADIATAALFEQQGFRLTGGTMTYLARAQTARPKGLRTRGRVRTAADTDHSQIITLAEDAFQDTRGRFQMDPNLPHSRVEAFYGEWTRRCLSQELADAVLVSEGQDGSLLGFLAYRQRQELSKRLGLPILGEGLGACRPAAAGAFLELVDSVISLAADSGGVAEAQTQNYNFAALRVFETLGMRPVRADYHFVWSFD